MNITTHRSFTGLLADHPLMPAFNVLAYGDGALSIFPSRLFRDWAGNDIEDRPWEFQIGRCVGLGADCIAKYDSSHQKLVIGSFVSIAQKARFVLNGQHEMRTISTSLMNSLTQGDDEARVVDPPSPQYGDTTVKNDVWVGDDVTFLGGSTVEDGCVIGARSLIPANFTSEPYGIYVGTPARLVRFRFSEAVRESLLKLAWWEMPVTWIKAHNHAFLVDLTVDEGRALDVLAALRQSKADWLEREAGWAG